MRVIIGDPDPKHVAYVKQILGILNHTPVGAGANATWMITAARVTRPDIAIVFAHFEDIRLQKTVQSLFANEYVKAVIIGAKSPITEIELVNVIPHTAVVMRPFTVQKMAEAIALATGTPIAVGKPSTPPKPAATPIAFERPSFVI